MYLYFILSNKVFVFTQQAHYAIMTSLIRQNDVKITSFWRYNDVIITSSVRYACTPEEWQRVTYRVHCRWFMPTVPWVPNGRPQCYCVNVCLHGTCIFLRSDSGFGGGGDSQPYELLFNSLRPSDAIWRQRSGPSHYLNQCWLIISKV